MVKTKLFFLFPQQCLIGYNQNVESAITDNWQYSHWLFDKVGRGNQSLQQSNLIIKYC